MNAPIATVEERLHLIKECYESGLTINEWCRRNGIERNTLHTWIRRLKKKGLIDTAAVVPKVKEHNTETPEIVKVEIGPGKRMPVRYEEELRRADKEERTGTGAVMEIDLGGIRIKVTNRVDPSLLAETIRLLGGGPGC